MFDSTASTEPPSEDGGETKIRSLRDLHFHCASTEPPSEDGGEGTLLPGVAVRRRASTEPPSEDGGELGDGTPHAAIDPQLQRSRRPKTAES